MPLPTPIGEQTDALYLSTERNVVVLGSAGSGKSTLAILRAAHLSNPDVQNHGRTLLVTFNVALVKYLEFLCDGSVSLENLETCNYHKFARGILKSLGEDMDNAIVEGERLASLVENAIAQTRQRIARKVFERPTAFFIEEFKWLAQNGVRSESAYTASERTGRTDSRLTRADRPAVFAAYSAYLELRSSAGFRYDWDDLASGVRNALRKAPKGWASLFKHVVIDEGQDFSPEMIRSLAESLPKGGTLTFFGDVAQQLYGHRISWKAAGIAEPIVKFFQSNHRNSKQIAQLAVALSEMPTFGHTAEELVVPRMPKADGAKPLLYQLLSADAQVDWATVQAERQGSTRSVAILARERAHEARIKNGLPKAIKLSRTLKGWKAGPGIYYGTVHAAKGMEFDTVILLFCGEEEVLADHWFKTLDHGEAQSVVSKMLYVGITRARSGLILTFMGEPSALLPNDADLYA